MEITSLLCCGDFSLFFKEGFLFSLSSPIMLYITALSFPFLHFKLSLVMVFLHRFLKQRLPPPFKDPLCHLWNDILSLPLNPLLPRGPFLAPHFPCGHGDFSPNTAYHGDWSWSQLFSWTRSYLFVITSKNLNFFSGMKQEVQIE